MTLSPAPNDPLRLAEAAKIAFPDGSITENSLRREIRRGNLAREIIAGKIYVTLNDIADMRARCRENPRGHASTSAAVRAGRQSGSSSTADSLKSARAAANLIAQALKNPSQTT
ncbi:excisionase [Agrobacterium tumefaciens]|uniref:excisionase n=1 Tax=Agrobacterium tumefaciens TaxID=358 RepID=UPI003BA15FF7